MALGKPPSVVHVPTRAVIRQTCGCIGIDKKDRSPGAQKGNDSGIDRLIDGLNIVEEQVDLYRQHAARFTRSAVARRRDILGLLSEIANTTLFNTGVLGQLQDLLMAFYTYSRTRNQLHTPLAGAKDPATLAKSC